MIKFEENDYEYILDIRANLLQYDYTVVIKGVTITIPKGFLFYDTTGGLIKESISVNPVSNIFEARYFMDYHPYETLGILNRFSSMEYKQNITFRKIKHNGLKAYHATYKDGNIHRYEIRFQIDEANRNKSELVLQVDTEDNNIKDIKESSEFKELFDGIRKEETKKEEIN